MASTVLFVSSWLKTHPTSIPRKFLKASTAAMKDICKARYEAFGSAGHASKIKPLLLETMIGRYESMENWILNFLTRDIIDQNLEPFSGMKEVLSMKEDGLAVLFLF